MLPGVRLADICAAAKLNTHEDLNWIIHSVAEIHN